MTGEKNKMFQRRAHKIKGKKRVKAHMMRKKKNPTRMKWAKNDLNTRYRAIQTTPQKGSHIQTQMLMSALGCENDSERTCSVSDSVSVSRVDTCCSKDSCNTLFVRVDIAHCRVDVVFVLWWKHGILRASVPHAHCYLTLRVGGGVYLKVGYDLSSPGWCRCTHNQDDTVRHEFGYWRWIHVSTAVPAVGPDMYTDLHKIK